MVAFLEIMVLEKTRRKMTGASGSNSHNPEGERWLTILGREDLIGETISYGDRTVPAEDFTDLCSGEGKIRAINTLRGLAALPPNDPKYPAMLNMVQVRFDNYLNGQEGNG